MPLSLHDVEAEVRSWPLEEREKLLAFLLRDLDGNDFLTEEIAEAWVNEADRRDRELDGGEVEGIPLDEVFRRARAGIR